MGRRASDCGAYSTLLAARLIERKGCGVGGIFHSKALHGHTGKDVFLSRIEQLGIVS